jgi:hypothetical protein
MPSAETEGIHFFSMKKIIQLIEALTGLIIALALYKHL